MTTNADLASELNRMADGRAAARDVADPRGALSEKDRAEADRGHASREEMPPDAFLEPAARKYPVKDRSGGRWAYSRNLLLAAAREARMHGHEDIGARADRIREGMGGA